MPDNFLTDEDKALFRQEMGTVKPLQKSKKSVLLPQKKPANNQLAKKPLINSEPITTYLSDYYAEAVQANTLLSYCSHSIPTKRFRELKNGKIPWQSQLDLHGQRAEAAKHSLIQFIEQQTALGHRCLLIIHGKGNHNGEAPVLKNLVNRWLPQFSQVLAFHSALTRDGGSGSVYVLLKHQRIR